MASPYRMEYWGPRATQPLVLDPRATKGPYMLLQGVKGLLPSNTTSRKVTIPQQRGDTLVGVKTSHRVIPCQVAIIAGSEEELWALRDNLAAALVVEPANVGELPEAGRLVLYRPGFPPVEAAAIPEDSPREASRVAMHDYIVDIEFVLPLPYWRAQEASIKELVSSGGFSFPLEHPFMSTSFNIQATPGNDGNVSAPMLLNIYGEVAGPRVVHVESGKVIDLDMTIPPGDRVEIDTAFGRKRVTWHKASGASVNAMRYLDLTVSELWWLQPGVNTVRFEADNNISGFVTIEWQSRWAGA